MEDVIDDAFGFKWTNSCAEALFRAHANVRRPHGARLFLSHFEAVRAVCERVKALDRGAVPSVDAFEMRLRSSEDIALAEWAVGKLHSPGGRFCFVRTLPTGQEHVVTNQDGAWTLTYTPLGGGERVTEAMEVGSTPPIAKHWAPATRVNAGVGALKWAAGAPRGAARTAAGALAPAMRDFNAKLRGLVYDSLPPAPPAGRAVASLGCGKGQELAHLRRRRDTVRLWRGWDVNREQLFAASGGCAARCAEMPFPAHAEEADCFAAGFRPVGAGEFDVVVCFFALQFALSSEAAALAALANAAALLRPGGVFTGITVDGAEVERWRAAADAAGADVAVARDAGGAPLVTVRFDRGGGAAEAAWRGRAPFGRAYRFNAVADAAGGELVMDGFEEFAPDRAALEAAAARVGLVPTPGCADGDWNARAYVERVAATASHARSAAAHSMLRALEDCPASTREANERLARFYAVFSFTKMHASAPPRP